MAAGNHSYEERFGIPAQALFGSTAVDLDYIPEYGGDDGRGYAPGYIPGSAAPEYDYPQYEPRERSRVKRAPVHAAPPKPVHKPGISLFTLAGCLLLAAATVFVLLANAQLTQITDEHAALQQEYARLMEENRLLSVRYERTFEPGRLEEYATGTLGMAKPVSGQYTQLPRYTEDKVVILDPNLGRHSLADGVRGFFSALLEYIG